MAKAKYTAIGGQALIEGILMRSPEKTALAVRKPDGDIDITYMKAKSLRDKYAILKIPIVRGVVAFAESLIQGYRAMMLSAEKSGYTDIEEEEKSSKKKAKEKAQKAQTEAAADEAPVENAAEQTESEAQPQEAESAQAAKAEEKNADKKTSAFMNIAMVIGSVLGAVLAVVLFIFLPRLAAEGIEALFTMWFNITFIDVVDVAIAQLIKIIVLVVYMWSVSLMPDIKRVFMYHGAEHKTIFCYEKGLELTVENVRKQKRFHPRCGTSFLILMVLVSVLVQTLLHLIPGLYDIRALWIATLILMIPVICGIGFEVLRFTGKYDNLLTRILSAPGMWLQRITTKEPADEMIEIAIAALRAAEPETPDVDRSVDKGEAVGE